MCFSFIHSPLLENRSLTPPKSRRSNLKSINGIKLRMLLGKGNRYQLQPNPIGFLQKLAYYSRPHSKALINGMHDDVLHIPMLQPRAANIAEAYQTVSFIS